MQHKKINIYIRKIKQYLNKINQYREKANRQIGKVIIDQFRTYIYLVGVNDDPISVIDDLIGIDVDLFLWNDDPFF